VWLERKATVCRLASRKCSFCCHQNNSTHHFLNQLNAGQSLGTGNRLLQIKQFTSIIFRVHRPSWCNNKQSCFVFRGSQLQTRPTDSMLVLSTSHGIKQDTSASCHISSVVIIIIIMPFGTSASLNKEIRFFCVLSNLYNISCTVNTQHTSRQYAIITIRLYLATCFGRKRPSCS